MARVSIVNRAKLSARLSWLLLRAGLRSVGGRVNGYRPLTWSVPPHKNDRLLIAPQDLRTADATRASEIYSGRFAFAGKVVICDGRSPFEIEPPSDEWADELLGFGWLRHLRAADSAITRANARALVDEWITLQGALAPGRLAPRCAGAADHLLAQPGAAAAAGRRRALLPPLPAQPAAAGALSAPHRRATRATARRACRR